MSEELEEIQVGSLIDQRLWRRLWPYLRPYRAALFAATAANLAWACTIVLWPQVFQRVVDAWNAPDMVPVMHWALAAFAALAVFGAAVAFVRVYLTGRIAQDLVADLRAALYARFQRMPLSYFDRTPAGKALARLVNDPNAIEDIVSTGFVTMVGNLMLLAGFAAAMVMSDPRLALVAFIAAPLAAVVGAVYRPLMRRAWARVRERIAHLSARMEENIAGHANILLLNQQARCAGEMDEANGTLRSARVRAAVLNALFPPLLQGSLGIGQALVIVYGGIMVMDNEISIGALAKFLIYMRMFAWPLQEIMESLQGLQAAMAALDRIFQFMEQPGEDLAAPAHPGAPAQPLPARARGEIEFQDVSFAYREDEWVLRDISFRVAPGERIALVGPTGAGKTTVLSLVSGLYRPTRGRILMDGRDIAALDPRWLRRQAAVVMQDVFIFSASATENVRLWEPAISDQDVRQACERACAASVVDRLPKGADTPLGERGAKLSAGERQLISFARALAYDPPILILDEATSSVDAETEDRIRRGLAALTSGRTSIIVAHRFSTLADVDRLLIIRDGRLTGETTPKEFLHGISGGWGKS
jgi:ATP-binding cassette, subfamily B, multidrug efflux pump